MIAETVTYYWCVPADSDAKRLRAVIDHLADSQGAPRFTPHLSLASIQGETPELSAILSGLRGLQLTPLEIDQSDVFTMSLFLRVAPHADLLRARTAFERTPGFRSSRAFDPHLSLCYGSPPPGAAGLKAVLELLEDPIRFDKLVTVDIPSVVRSYDDIRAWNLLETHPF